MCAHRSHLGQLASLVCLLTFLGPAARAAELDQVFESPKGFSIGYPSAWKVATKEQDEARRREVAPYVAKLGANLDGVAVMIIDPANAQFPTNVNVVVTPGAIPLSDENEAKRQAHGMMQKIASTFGAKLSGTSADVEVLGGHKALVSRYTLTLPAGTTRKMQAMMPGRDQTYIVSCTAAASDYDAAEPTFRAMAASTKFPGGVGMPKWATTALIGGVVGAVVGAISWLAKSARKKTPAPV